MKRARFLEEAEAEFLWEVEYYANLQPNGENRFAMAVEEAARRALAFPLAGPSYRFMTRRVFVRGFPFYVVYRPHPDGIVILAVVHEARRPDYWFSRARSR